MALKPLKDKTVSDESYQLALDTLLKDSRDLQDAALIFAAGRDASFSAGNNSARDLEDAAVRYSHARDYEFSVRCRIARDMELDGEVYCDKCMRKIPLIWSVLDKKNVHEEPGLSTSDCKRIDAEMKTKKKAKGKR